MKSLADKQRQLWKYILTFYEYYGQFSSHENIGQAISENIRPLLVKIHH